MCGEEIPKCYTRPFCQLKNMCSFADEMYISKAKKYRDQGDGTAIAYDYYRLTKSYIDKDGKTKHRSVLCLGELPGLDKDERNRLASMLTTMIEEGQSVMCDNQKLYEEAMSQYVKYRSSRYAQENDPRLIAERKAREEEERKKAVAVKLETLTQHEARVIGCENLCNSTMRLLDIRKYLNSKGWEREEINLALMQIIARAIYPYSELKTVRYLRENTALAEMFGIPKEKITKDALYKSARRLWEEHRGLEDWLHDRVCSMFGIEEKILLFDITNSYFEGKMEDSELCQYGRSKEKRDDCKIVVLAAVVNTEGLLVRTMIYEGNRHDSTTVEEVVGSLAKTTSPEAKRIVVMNTGFYSKSNVNWLKANGFDYITVLPSGNSKLETASPDVIDHTDNKGQQIRLQMGKVDMDGESVKALLVVAVTNSPKHDFNRCKSATCKFLSRDTKSARDKNGTKPRKNKVKNTLPEISLVEYLCFVCKGTNLSLEKRGEIPISLIHNSFSYHCTPNVVIANGFDLKRLGLRKLGVNFCFALCWTFSKTRTGNRTKDLPPLLSNPWFCECLNDRHLKMLNFK